MRVTAASLLAIQDGVQRPRRLLAVTTLDALKFRNLVTANAMYLPHPQEAVIKIRGLPPQLCRQGAVGLILQAAGYSAPDCVCRAEYTMPAVLPGGQVAPWLEDPSTLCAVGFFFSSWLHGVRAR
jgi:hypothetical protein